MSISRIPGIFPRKRPRPSPGSVCRRSEIIDRRARGQCTVRSAAPFATRCQIFSVSWMQGRSHPGWKRQSDGFASDVLRHSLFKHRIRHRTARDRLHEKSSCSTNICETGRRFYRFSPNPWSNLRHLFRMCYTRWRRILGSRARDTLLMGRY